MITSRGKVDIATHYDETKGAALIADTCPLKARLTALTEPEHRSLNKQIEFLLDRSVRDEEQAHETGDSNRQKGERVKRK